MHNIFRKRLTTHHTQSISDSLRNTVSDQQSCLYFLAFLQFHIWPKQQFKKRNYTILITRKKKRNLLVLKTFTATIVVTCQQVTAIMHRYFFSSRQLAKHAMLYPCCYTVQTSFISIINVYTFSFINWFIKRHKVVISEAPFLPRDGRNHLQYSLHLPSKGRLGWVGLDKFRDGRPARGRHQSQNPPPKWPILCRVGR